ncbi:LT_GEWL domain containing protein [uncultured Caudovirales phage]|uniref:LT_GEWL domain containing protein n=1 Tax=uncultured Caudovirales phage TaxID=2100421 RepID=A0A6J5KN75_9CAUD|nr:LT_GEWL domain containing protein [uncultured Caudovirales phage]
MDELGSLILGEAPKTKASTSEISDQLLDSLRRVESGGNPKAVNPKSGAMGAYQFMPATVESMRKQGIEFDPFNEKEARAVAKGYLEKLTKQHGGDVNKALAAYGGFVTKDPTAYVQNVMQGANKTFAGDELGSLILGKATPSAPQTQPQTQPQAKAQPSVASDMMATAIDKAKNPSRSVAELLQQYQEKKRSLGESVAGGIDTLYGATVPAAYGAITQALARTANTPERAEQIGQAAAASIDQPLGKAFGITGKESYQHPLGAVGTKVGEAINHMFNVLHMTPEQISEKTGVPAADIRNMAVTGSFLIPSALKEGKAVVGKVTQEGKVIAGKVAQPLREMAAELQVTTPQQMKAQFAAKQAPAGSTGAAKVEANPYAGQITGEEGARGQFPQIKLSKITKDVAPNEQVLRSQAVQEVMPNQQVRPGVVTGNENTLRNEYTKAKMDTPEGLLYKQQIAKEQNALSDYAQQRVENTGASPTLVTPYERGQRINDAFAGDDGLAGFFKGEKKKLYDDVANKVGENPITSSHVENLLADKQFKAGLGLKGNEGVGRSAEELINHAKTIGFKDDMGNVYGPNTVGAWTAVQKSLNSNWTPQNASIIRKINQAIESDIGQAGGLDMLKKADSLHQAEKVLFGSKGIKQIFGDIDPNGVQTATAFDAIPQKLNSMPLDQWKHIYDTAEKVSKGTISGPIDKATGMPKWVVEVPEELRISAQSAMNEMRGNIAREIYQAGATKAGEWNQNSVNKILNARADKIKMAFSPEEQKAFHTLNTVGHLMPGAHGYEGAGLQARRVGVIEGNLGKIGTTLGAGAGTAIFGPGAGTAIGGYVGGKAGVAGSEAMATRSLNKQAVKAEKQMKKATELGKIKPEDFGK